MRTGTKFLVFQAPCLLQALNHATTLPLGLGCWFVELSFSSTMALSVETLLGQMGLELERPHVTYYVLYLGNLQNTTCAGHSADGTG